MCILLLIGNIPGPSSSNVCISVNSHFSSASGRLNYQTRRMFIVIMSKRTWHLSFSLSHECNSFLIHNREKKIPVNFSCPIMKLSITVLKILQTRPITNNYFIK